MSTLTPTERALVLKNWYATRRHSYIKTEGVNAKFYYFQFDDSGHGFIPATRDHLVEYFTLLSDNDKETFFLLSAPGVDLDPSKPCNISWDLIRGHQPDGYIFMTEWLQRLDVNLDELKARPPFAW
jgi:hypothetical protein